MKKTSTLTFTLLMAAMISVSAQSSTLSINSNLQNGVRVSIDGSRYRVSNNGITINRLEPGTHRLQVYVTSGSFKPGRGNDGGRLIYNGNLYVRPRHYVDVTINRFGRVFIDQRPLDNLYDWSDHRWDNEPWNNGRWDNDDRDNDRWDNDRWDNDRWNNGRNNGRPMNAATFQRFLESVRNESFDNTRINIARQVIGANRISTEQLRQLLPLFSFEENKLEVAKYAYAYTTDPNNYFSVADSFGFSTSKDELMRYIRDQR